MFVCVCVCVCVFVFEFVFVFESLGLIHFNHRGISVVDVIRGERQLERSTWTNSLS